MTDPARGLGGRDAPGDRQRSTGRLVRDLEDQRDKSHELEGRLKERDQQIKELRTDEAKLLRDRRKLEDEKDDLEREKERMRDEIRKQERDEAERRAKERSAEELRRTQSDYQEKLLRKQDEHDTRTRQLKEQLKRVNAQLEDAQRKSSSSARQQEGVARQDLFAEDLRGRFPDDQIIVTGVGKRGPDVTQVVRIGRLDCGVILWECKRTAAWSMEWPRKLAGEVGAAEARFGVIVSEILPADIEGRDKLAPPGYATTSMPGTLPLVCGKPSSQSTAMWPRMPREPE